MRGLAGVLVVSSLALAGPAYAQGSSAAIASEAFERGRKLAASGKWNEACVAFEQSQAAEAAFGTQYNLAGCYVKIGKLASAWALYLEVAQGDSNAARKKDSSGKAQALAARLPKLQVNAPDAPAGLTITVDGTSVSPGVAIPVDLGPHAVVARAPRHAEVTLSPSVKKEAETVSVDVKLLPMAAAPVREPVATTEPVTGEPAPVTPIDLPPPERKGRGRWPWIVVGGGAVLVGVGAYFGLEASSGKQDADDICAAGACTTGSNEFFSAQSAIDKARDKALYSTIFFAAGLAAIGVGTYLVLTGGSDDEAATRISLGGGGSPLGVTLGGGF